MIPKKWLKNGKKAIHSLLAVQSVRSRVKADSMRNDPLAAR